MMMDDADDIELLMLTAQQILLAPVRLIASWDVGTGYLQLTRKMTLL